MSKQNVCVSRPPVRSVSLLLVFFFVCCLTVPSGTLAQEQLKVSYERAQHLFNQGNHVQAAAAFRALLVQTYQDRANLYQQEGLWKEAGRDIRAALSLNSSLSELRYKLAYTDFRLHHYKEASSLLKELARAAPKVARIHALLGKTYFSLGENNAARRELQLALRLNPDDHLTAYTLALADLAGKDVAAASRIFAQLASSMGDSAKYRLVVARAYSDAGYQQAARQELGRALAMDSKTRYAHYLLAIALLREKGTGGLEQAKAELAREDHLFPDEFEAKYLLGVLLLYQHHWESAGHFLLKALRISPEQPEAYFYLGNVYVAQNQPHRAVTALCKGLALAKLQGGTRFPLYRAHLLLSRAYRSIGKTNESVREAREAGQLFRAESSGERETRDVDTRLRESVAGLSLPSSTVTWKDPSPSVPLTARQKRLLSVYGQVLVSGRNYLARIAVSKGNFEEAARQFEQVRNLQPDYPEVNFRLGLAWFKAGGFTQALKPLENALARNPADPSARKYLGLTYFELGQYDKAVKPLEEAQRLSPNDPEVLLSLGGALARSHRAKEAQAVLAQLISSHPNSAAVHILLGRAYAAQSKTPQAEKEFRRALEIDPKAPSVHLYLGLLEMQDGRMAEAGKEFKAELQAHPDALQARYNLAFVLLRQQKIDEALPLLHEVIRENPRYSEAYYSLGKALLDQGHVQEAIGELRKAVQLDPKKAYSHYQLGRAYLMAGQRKEAEQEFVTTRKLKDQQLKFHHPAASKTP